MRKIATIGLSALAAFALACGAGSGNTTSSADGATPSSGQQTVTAAIGQTVTLTSAVLNDKTVVDVTLADPEQFAVEPGAFGSKAKNGVFLVLTVTVVCKEGTYHANPFNFKFVAADGTVSEGAFAVGFDPSLRATDLSSGQKVAGKIVFDVAQAALTGGRVQIDGTGLDYDKPGAYWAL